MSGKHVGVILLVIAVVGGFWYMRHDRDARQIWRQFDALVEAAEKEPGDSQVALVRKSRTVQSSFTSNAVIRLSPIFIPEIERRELAALVFYFHGYIDSVRIQISDRRLTIADDRQSADMRFTARGRLERAGRREINTHAFRMEWVKHEGDWLIDRVEVHQSIRPPGRSPE